MRDDLAHLTETLADRYRVERELGAGGMATVYLAHDIRHDRKVALKVLRPELAAILGADRFLQEIKTTANLQHSHILPLHDSGEVDGVVFYVMPYVEGESLRDRLRREHQLPVDEAIRLATEVASALDYAHRHGVIHRDIKPENVLLHDGQALVADFGIALAVSRSEGSTRMTETGMSLGTPHYMSPEQAMGEREITAKSDVYALGCVVYEMLVGEPPFTGPTAQAIVARVVTEEPRSMILQRKTIPPYIEAAVDKALAKLPADRFATAAQFAEALAGHGAVTPTTRATAVPAGFAAAAPWRARFLITAAVAMVSLVLGLWGWLKARAARQPTTWQYVTLGDSVQAAVSQPSFALSPDGSMLVFRESRPNYRLWLKRRNELAATPISGTERGANPTFSPDGQWIAFISDGHLKKVRATGGATVTVADSVAVGFGGVAWLDASTLVYVTPDLTTLRRVDAAGGPATEALHGAAMGGLGVSIPQALPNGRGVLFEACTSGCVAMGLNVLDLRTGKQKRLLDEVAGGWYLPSGQILYVRRDGVALVAPFDLGRLEPSGAAVPVLEGVQITPTAAPLLAWSRSGSLVYIQGAGGTPDINLVRVNRAGAVTPIDTAWFGQFNSSAVSPDGRLEAVGVGTGSGLNIWIKRLDHGPFTRLTFGNGDRRPAWSPDGRLVAFIRDSSGTSTVRVRPADGSGNERLLVHLDRLVQEVTWSRDGRWLITRTDNGTTGAGDIVGVSTSGDTTPVPLVNSPFTELHPALSPDGRWLAYSSNESGTYEVYVRPFPNTGGARWQISNGGGIEPRWSPTGHELYFLSNTNAQLMAADFLTTPTFTVNSVRPLFDASRFVIDAFHTSYDVTPDGRSFVFAMPHAGATVPQPQMVWVDNWFQDVRARLAH